MLHDNGTSESFSGSPASYLYHADYAIWLQPFMPRLGRRAPGGGGGGASFPGAGSVSKFASSPSLQESLGFHSCQRVLGETTGLQTHWHILAYTTAYLNVIINALESPRLGPAARRAGLSADRKELIN